MHASQSSTNSTLYNNNDEKSLEQNNTWKIFSPDIISFKLSGQGAKSGTALASCKSGNIPDKNENKPAKCNTFPQQTTDITGISALLSNVLLTSLPCMHNSDSVTFTYIIIIIIIPCFHQKQGGKQRPSNFLVDVLWKMSDRMFVVSQASNLNQFIKEGNSKMHLSLKAP